MNLHIKIFLFLLICLLTPAEAVLNPPPMFECGTLASNGNDDNRDGVIDSPACPNTGQTCNTTDICWEDTHGSVIPTITQENDATASGSTVKRASVGLHEYASAWIAFPANFANTGNWYGWIRHRGGGRIYVSFDTPPGVTPKVDQAASLPTTNVLTWSSINQLIYDTTSSSLIVSTAQRAFNVASTGDKVVWILLTGGIDIDCVYFSRTATATPTCPSAVTPPAPNYGILKVNAGITVDASCAADADWTNAPEVTFSGTQDAGWTGTRTLKLLYNPNTTPDRVFFRVTATDTNLQATVTTNDSGAPYNDDSLEILLGSDLVNTFDSEVVKLIFNLQEAIYDQNYPSGAADLAYSSGALVEVCNTGTLNNSGDTDTGFTIEGRFNLNHAVVDNQLALCNFMHNNKNAARNTKLAFGTQINSLDSAGICRFSSAQVTAPPGDTTQPTYGSTSETNITQTDADIVITNVADNSGNPISVQVRYGASAGNYSLGASATLSVASGNSVTAHLPKTGDPALPSGTQIFYVADLTDSSNNTRTTTEDSFTTQVSSANTFYIAPDGSDGNPGTSAQPWKTWGFATNKARLLAGYTLIAKNGSWTNLSSCAGLPTPCAASQALPDLNCTTSGNANNGTATNRITIKAQNERQAFIKSNGNGHAFHMNNCSYWNVEGLRAESGDIPSGNTFSYVFLFEFVNNVNLKRLLAAKPNRYNNTHAIGVNDSSNVLVEESEAYWFHRWGIIAFTSSNITFRRNYANSRDYPDIAGALASIVPNTGDFGLGFYDTDYTNPLMTRDSIVENSISENNSAGINLGASPSGGFNKGLGLITISNSNVGMVYAGRGSQGFNLLAKDNVSIDDNNPYQVRSGTNARIENSTLFSSDSYGLYIDDLAQSNSGQNTEFRSTFVINTLLVSNAAGVFLTGQDDWLFDYVDSFGNGSANYPTAENISDATGNIRHSLSIAPTGMGTGANQCIAYVPVGSNMKGAGEAGADIGANIIYRYENGVLTSQKLWNQATGQFPCGATVTGVNDDASFPNSACVNVHKRVNIGVNGCAIP